MADEKQSNKKVALPANLSDYARAVLAGNAFRCLPVELRQEVFAYAALDCLPAFHKKAFVEAADIRAERQCAWLPPMCLVNDDFFFESLPMFLRHANIVVREQYTAYNLRFFLHATNLYPYIHSLRFTVSKALTPLSAGPQLLQDCINLRHVFLAFHIKDFKFKFHHPRGISNKLDKKAFLEDHSFRQLLTLSHLERVQLYIVHARNDPQIIYAQGDAQNKPKKNHLPECWGIVGWLKRKFLRRGRVVQVLSGHGQASEIDPVKPLKPWSAPSAGPRIRSHTSW